MNIEAAKSSANEITLRLGDIVERRRFRPHPGRPKVKPQVFYLILRKNKLICVWQGNRRKSDLVLAKVRCPHRGLSSDDWAAVSRHVKKFCEQLNKNVLVVG